MIRQMLLGDFRLALACTWLSHGLVHVGLPRKILFHTLGHLGMSHLQDSRTPLHAVDPQCSPRCTWLYTTRCKASVRHSRLSVVVMGRGHTKPFRKSASQNICRRPDIGRSLASQSQCSPRRTWLCTCLRNLRYTHVFASQSGPGALMGRTKPSYCTWIRSTPHYNCTCATRGSTCRARCSQHHRCSPDLPS
jgi:hypothetical protein